MFIKLYKKNLYISIPRARPAPETRSVDPSEDIIVLVVSLYFASVTAEPIQFRGDVSIGQTSSVGCIVSIYCCLFP